MDKTCPICGMKGTIPAHGKHFCSEHCIIKYEENKGIEHFDLNNDVPPHRGTLLPPPKPNQELISENSKEDYYPVNLYSGYYNWKPYQYHYYFYPYRRYLRPYYSYYKPGRWYRHYGNYYYVW